MAKLISQWCGELQPTIYLSRRYGAIWRQLKHLWMSNKPHVETETSHSKSSLGNFPHQYLSELLVNVYSYHLMVKSVSWCCVCGSWLLPNPVIYTDWKNVSKSYYVLMVMSRDNLFFNIYYYNFVAINRIWDNPPSMHNYLEIPILIIWSIITQEGKLILKWNLPWFYSYL